MGFLFGPALGCCTDSAYALLLRPCHRSKFHDAVYTGRWVFLVVVACQVLAMVLAVVLRSITPQDYQEFEEEQYQERKAASEKQVGQGRGGGGASCTGRRPLFGPCMQLRSSLLPCCAHAAFLLPPPHRSWTCSRRRCWVWRLLTRRAPPSPPLCWRRARPRCRSSAIACSAPTAPTPSWRRATSSLAPSLPCEHVHACLFLFSRWAFLQRRRRVKSGQTGHQRFSTATLRLCAHPQLPSWFCVRRPAPTDARGAWGAPTLPQAPAAWPAEQRQPQQQRSFKPSWSKAAKH